MPQVAVRVPAAVRLAVAVGIAWPFLAWAAEPASKPEFDLDAASRSYTDTWRQIESRKAERLSTLKQQYLDALDKAVEAAMKKGDLDGVLAAKAEKDRILTDSPVLQPAAGSTPPSLRNLLDSYEHSHDRIAKEQDQQLRALNERYVATLTTQERALTRQGRLDEALAVRAEKERVMDDLPEAAAPAAEEPATEPLKPAPAASPQSPAKEPALKLMGSWNSGGKGGGLVMSDLHELLAAHGRPNVDLAADPSIEIFSRITYLMPVREAALLFNQRLAARNFLNSPPFPQDSLYYYTFGGSFIEGFNVLVLITDRADQVVAVQLVNEHPEDKARLQPAAFSQKWHCYNFVQNRSKASKAWCIGLQAQLVNRVAQVDSEVVSIAPERARWMSAFEGQTAQWEGKVRERSRLFLPEPIVNLILKRIQDAK